MLLTVNEKFYKAREDMHNINNTIVLVSCLSKFTCLRRP